MTTEAESVLAQENINLTQVSRNMAYISAQLEHLSASFWDTGNREVARTLNAHADNLRKDAAIIRVALNRIAQDHCARAMESSDNMLRAAIAGAALGAGMEDK